MWVNVKSNEEKNKIETWYPFEIENRPVPKESWWEFVVKAVRIVWKML